MENKAHALIAGLFTIVLLAGTIFLGIWLNRDRVEWVPYLIATKLTVSGLNPQAAVRYRGLEVGKVSEITFDPNELGQILVRFNVQPGTPITQSTYATLGYQGVTGIAYLQLDDDDTHPVKMPSSTDKVARIELRPSVLDWLQNRGQAILANAEEMTNRINVLLEPENREAILATINNIGEAASEFKKIPRQLQPTLSKLPALTNQAHDTLNEVASLSKDAKTLTNHLNGIATRLQASGGAIDTISGSATQFGSAASRIEDDSLSLATDAHTSLSKLNDTLDNLNEYPNSVLFGAPAPAPGPGEPGFVTPSR